MGREAPHEGGKKASDVLSPLGERVSGVVQSERVTVFRIGGYAAMREERRQRDNREAALKDAVKDIESFEAKGDGEEETYVFRCAHPGCDSDVHAPKNFRCRKHSSIYYEPYWVGYRRYANFSKVLSERCLDTGGING